MNKIIAYIKEKYNPLSIIIYGSYADGSNNENSDFDALVISDNEVEMHDVGFVSEIQLDVFVYPKTYFENEIDYDAFIEIHDGRIEMDTDDMGHHLKEQVLSYIANIPKKSQEEIYSDVEWCKKMMLRTKRKDAEGMFRWHWLLTESLQIYCDVIGINYWGPKKSIKWMEKNQPKAFAIYQKALMTMDESALEEWIWYLDGLV